MLKIEIPTADFQQAVTFYQHILDITLEEADMVSTRLGVFPADGGSAF